MVRSSLSKITSGQAMGKSSEKRHGIGDGEGAIEMRMRKANVGRKREFNLHTKLIQKSRYEMEDYKLFEDRMNSNWTYSRKCQREIHESVEKALEECSKTVVHQVH